MMSSRRSPHSALGESRRFRCKPSEAGVVAAAPCGEAAVQLVHASERVEVAHDGTKGRASAVNLQHARLERSWVQAAAGRLAATRLLDPCLRAGAANRRLAAARAASPVVV